MWKGTLCCNVLILFLFWLLSLVLITPAYNHFVQYGSYAEVLPQPTGIAVRFRIMSVVLPVFWAVGTVIVGKWLNEQPVEKRNEYV